MIRLWLGGLLRRRGSRLAGAMIGVAIAVALLGSLGAFLAGAQAAMTARAVRDVAVDWQVQVQPGAAPGSVLATTRAAPGVRAAAPVDFAHVAGLSATLAGTTQTTGAGVVLGLPAGYRAQFPGEIRTLVGAGQGVLLAQQTAANLHAAPGDVITIDRGAGQAPAPVTVAGVIDLPQANSLFQTVGAPPSAQPAAPPDNVVLLPGGQWHQLFDPLTAARPDLTFTQVHVARDRQLPPGPAAAYTQVSAAAHHLEAQTAGAAKVGDNLGAALDAARSDAAYARILFLFLGLPGAVLAGLLTAAVTAAGAPRRRSEQGLARLRGMRRTQLVGLAAVEAAVVGIGGSLLGLGLAALVGQVAFGSPRFGADPAAAAVWLADAVLAGVVIAAAAVLAPAWRDARHITIAAARQEITRTRGPWWARLGLDVLLLAAGGLLVWAAGANGYQLVLAPEGVPQVSVSYWAFTGPALLWLGAGLLTWRITDLVLGRGRRLVGRALRPSTGALAHTAAAMMARRRAPLARSIVLLALTLGFAVSTATFNATYQAQALVDAQLTNGADVTVTQPPGSTVGPAAAARLAAVAGVVSAQPLLHRFAYIGADVQDLYGVNPATITQVTTVQNSYFVGGTAAQLMHQLAAAPDSILVSAETVKDYQLQPGDQITLRLTDAATHQLTHVTFHYAGIVKEFPTAPKDSFFVANSAYVAAQTGSTAVGAFLVDTGGRNVTAVADRIRALLGTSATVTDIAHTSTVVGSSLTAVDLTGLTRVELGFAIVLAAAAAGLVLALGFTERRRTFAITTALGATTGQLRRLIAAETTVLAVGGLLAGAGIGALLANTLINVLTGVFDPPPDVPTVPWPYLAATGTATLAALALATALAVQRAHQPPISVLREL